MITYSDVEIESCQLTGGSCSCVPRGAGIQHQTRDLGTFQIRTRHVTFN